MIAGYAVWWTLVILGLIAAIAGGVALIGFVGVVEKNPIRRRVAACVVGGLLVAVAGAVIVGIFEADLNRTDCSYRNIDCPTTENPR